MKKEVMTPYLAVAIAEGFCEGEGASREEQVEAWQYIIDQKLYLHLQGWFVRTARNLIEEGVCHAKI
jgi:hypothetical protein